MKKGILLFILLAQSTAWCQPKPGTGLLFNKIAEEKVNMVTKPIGFGDGLPKAKSLLQYAPSISDQGAYGTCVGWSSTYYIATIEMAKKLNLNGQAQIDAIAFDPYFTYLGIIGNNDPDSYSTCENGTYLTDACDFLYENGPKPFTYNKLSCGDDTKALKNRRFSILKFTDYYRVYDEDDSDYDNVVSACQMIANDHPVIIGMITTESLYKIGKDGVFNPSSKERANPADYSYGGHALSIIGYDDNLNGGCFEIVNSWGNQWGKNGRFYLRYTDYCKFVQSAFAFETELMEPNSSGDEPVYYGNVEYGYGAKKVLGTGFMEGSFSKGKLQQGIYFNAVDSKKHQKTIKKGTKKKSFVEYTYLTDASGKYYKSGFILK